MFYAFILLQALPAEATTAIKQTAANTAFLPWTCVSISIAAVAAVFAGWSLWYAWKTLRSQRQTEANTYRLLPEVQKKLLEEMCRHLYRNMVVSYTIGVKIKKENYRAYPSEEHLAKMKVNLEDIHDEIFYKEEDHFFDISKLYVLLRNYNAELDIICKHLSSPTIDVDTKKRDVKTLLFKCHFLIDEIVKFAESVWPGRVVPVVKELIENEWRGNRGVMPEFRGGFTRYDNHGTVFTDTLFPGEEAELFLAHFNEDVRIELGHNNEKSEKIHMIEFA